MSKLDLPVLFVAGEHDQITSADEMHAMAELVSGSAFARIEGVGHISPLERPEEFNRCVLDFLETLHAQVGEQ